MPSPLLSAAIEEYLASREGVLARSTVAGDRQTLNYLLLAIGNVPVKNLEARHGEEFMSYLAKKGMQNSTKSAHHIKVGTFVKWLKTRKYLGLWENPLASARRPKVQSKVRQLVPQTQFERLLDASATPRARMIVALGLYVFVRASEVRVFRLDDVNLDRSVLLVRQPKTGKQDEMPICTELDTELRRWLTYYHTESPRPLNPSDPLVPALLAGRALGGDYRVGRTIQPVTLNPDKPIAKPAQLVKRTLKAAGYDLTDDWGKPLYEGCHTLRRSGARALFDHLVDDRGFDGAIRMIQAMLHHDSLGTTERYLQLNLDIKKRNDLLQGRAMFTPATDNVVRLEVTS